MTPMLEKATRALEDGVHVWVDRDARVHELTGSELRALVTLVLKAVREPDEGMLRACWQNHHPWHENAPLPEDRPEGFDAMKADVQADWQAMIDHILSEEPK